MTARDPEILFEGPAGTGKSRAALEKVYIAAQNYPGMRALIARKTRKSITHSVQVTFEQEVGAGAPFHIKLHRTDQEYRFPNRSRVVVAGMNDPEKVKSTQYDLIFVNEGTEITTDDYETLLTRNRNGVMPYQQIIVDCNPGAPNHWLNQRANNGLMRRLKGTHRDNPRLFNKDGTATELGAQYMARLDSLTGVRYHRLRSGLWVAAEGIVFPEWDPARHIAPMRRIPLSWKRWISVDFGYRDPFVALWWTQDPANGQLICYREIYHSERLVQAHAHQMFEQSYGETIQAIITDHDAEDRATLEAHWHKSSDCPGTGQSIVNTIKAEKDISTGLEAIRARLTLKNGIVYLDERLLEFDHELKETARPTETTQEFESYTWDTRESERLGTIRKEAPIDRDNHGIDATRYFIKFIDTGSLEAWKQLLTGSSTMRVTSNDPGKPLDILDAWNRLLSQR